MNVIQGTLTVNGRPRNGAEAKLWRAEGFSSPPGLDSAEPTDVSYQVGSSITTGPAYGGEGAYRFIGMDDGAYYVSLIVGAQRVWEGHVVSGGAGTQEFDHRLENQCHEYAQLSAGQTITLFHDVGAGVVRQIFLAIESASKAVVEDETVIKVFVNGQGVPSIGCPLSQFFGYTFEAGPFWSQRFAVTRKEYDDVTPLYQRGAYRYLNMPYSSEMRIVLDIGSSEPTQCRVFSIVYNQDLATKESWGRDTHLKGDHFEDLAVVPYTSVELLNVAGRGRLDSLVLSVESPESNAVLEGNLEVYVDGAAYPAWYVTGTEDISGNAFYFGTGQVTGPYQGAPVHNDGPPSQSTLYRLFDLDQLDFDQSLKIVWWAGHKGQASPLTQDVKVRSTVFYYLDAYPSEVQPGQLNLEIEDTFDSYGEGNPIAGNWIQRNSVDPQWHQWVQSSNRATHPGTGTGDAWLYHDQSDTWTDYVVEADLKVNNQGTGEVWLFARGSRLVNGPDFDSRITWGLSAQGAETEHPDYVPVMTFVASGAINTQSLQFLKVGELNTLRLEVSGGLVIVSMKRSVDSDFRELFRFVQTSRNDGVAGISQVSGDVEVDAFRLYRRAA